MERLGIGLIAVGGAVMLAQRGIVALLEAREERARRRRSTPCGNPWPKVPHKALPPGTTQYKRVVIVGDVHGCPEELQALLDKLAFRKGVDLLLSVGDLVNKGPDSEQVLKLARDNGMLAVRGNHDDAAYAAFRAWLDGKDVPKPQKHWWVPGLDESLADVLALMPLTIELPAYGVLLVHAGLVPGVPLEQQRGLDMLKMRDLVAAAEAAQADAAAAALAAGEDVGSLPVGAFDWDAARAALAALAAAAPRGGLPGGRSGPAPGEAAPGEAAADQQGAPPAGSALPPGLALEGREVPNPLGRPWASLWPGPAHIFFGHDAVRRLQRSPAATGLDTGCVYGGQLTAAVLPPLDESGQPVLTRLNLPQDAEEIRLASGLPAYLVSVPAKEVHSDKYQKAEQQVKGRRLEAAKRHTEEARGGARRGAAAVEMAARAAAAADGAGGSKPASDKKDE